MCLYGVFRAASVFLQILDFAIILYCVMSWFRPRNRFFDWLTQFVEPIMAPFRGISMWIMQKTGIPLDFTPVFAIIALNVIGNLLWRLYAILA